MPTKDKEKRKAQNKRYRDNHPDTKNIRNRNETPETKRRWNLVTRYNLTPEQVSDMFKSQGGLCAICDKPLTSYRIDHDHKTGQVRGLLCHRCNLLIAGMEDESFSQAALDYLSKYANSR